MAQLLIFAALLLCSATYVTPRSDVRHDGVPTGFAVASYSSFGPVTVDTNILFGFIETNVGSSWNGNLNLFTAPMDGFYLFTASIGSAADTACDASIYVDYLQGQDKRVASLSTSETGPGGGSNQILLLLSEGDQVSLQLHANGGSTYSSPEEILVTFSGMQLNNPGPATPFHLGDPVAFSVRAIDGYGPVTVDTNIPFPVVEIAEGIIGWNPITNNFRAPLDGFYVFGASIGSSGSSTTASIVVLSMAGSRRVATLQATGAQKGHFNSMVLELQQGDLVSVQLHAYSNATFSSPSEILSTFTGIWLSNSDATP